MSNNNIENVLAKIKAILIPYNDESSIHVFKDGKFLNTYIYDCNDNIHYIFKNIYNEDGTLCFFLETNDFNKILKSSLSPPPKVELIKLYNDLCNKFCNDLCDSFDIDYFEKEFIEYEAIIQEYKDKY
jgi:hypothetical protein